jgi:hypothetical protein
MTTGAFGVSAIIAVAAIIYYAIASVADLIGDRVFGKVDRRRW